MLYLTVPGEENFDEQSNSFFTVGDTHLELEHSLLAVSKWESIYLKPFLAKEERTSQETEFYIRAMIISPNPPEDVVRKFTDDNMKAVNAYIESSATATTFGAMPETRGRGETITSELIYYWMVVFQIPFECERWHLNRLFSLIRICNLKSGKQKKLSKQEIARRNRDLNAKRKAELGTNG